MSVSQLVWFKYDLLYKSYLFILFICSSTDWFHDLFVHLLAFSMTEDHHILPLDQTEQGIESERQKKRVVGLGKRGEREERERQ